MYVIISKNINKEKPVEKFYPKPQLEWKSYLKFSIMGSVSWL